MNDSAQARYTGTSARASPGRCPSLAMHATLTLSTATSSPPQAVTC